ncbi:vitamin B12 dependent-methionine synthase activation domain-containing protein [Gemmatimonadota bacterium]
MKAGPDEGTTPAPRVISLDPAEIMPSREAVFEHQGIPAGSEVPDHIAALHAEASDLFAGVARPEGVVLDIQRWEFGAILAGEGLNALDVLVAGIYPQADHLALFAATMGQEVSDRIEAFFTEQEFAQGSMLDSVASQAADQAATVLEDRCREGWRERDLVPPKGIVRAYSPGYCGWHISGQRALFDRLRPEQIGITLNESFLMTPLKSVSGVLIAGPVDSHMFVARFSYCPSCTNRSCVDRMERLVAEKVRDRRRPGA